MKKLLLFGLLAFAAVALVAPPPASATTLPASLYEGSLEDASSLFRSVDGSNFLQPIQPGATIQVGDEQRTAFRMDALEFQGILTGSTQPPGTQEISAAISLPGYSSNALSGLLYDIGVTGFSGGSPPAVGSPADIYFGIGSRYTSAGGSDGTWTDLHAGQTSGILATTGGGYGGLIVVYDDAPQSPGLAAPALVGDGAFPGGDGDGTGGSPVGDGHDDWRQPGDVSGTSPHPGAAAMAVPDGSLTNADYFPSISDPAGAAGPGDTGAAKVLLVAVLAPLPPAVLSAWGVPAGTVLVERQFDPTSGGSGLAFANVIGGSLASLMRSDIFGPGLDIRLDFEMEIGGEPGGFTVDGWQIDSDDPVQFGVVPEPATMSLLGLGLLGLVGAKARRKK